MPIPLPAKLREAVDETGLTAWMGTRLPAAVRAAEAQWSLEIGMPFEPGGRTAWVAPARCPRWGDVVLKVGRRDDDCAQESDALRAWEGDGAVRLLDEVEVDGASNVLLLERCYPGGPLSERPGREQDEVIAGLLRRLWRTPAGEGLRSLQAMCDAWVAGCLGRLAQCPGSVDPGLVCEGLALFSSLPGDAERRVLLCTDLHAGNVLAAQRQPWLVIDPKPHVGDPTYDALQHLLNCPDRLAADPRGLIERMATLLELDADRLERWLFARCIVEQPGRPDLLPVARRIARRVG